MSSFQLHWSSTIEPFAAVVLNVAAHHLDWHGSLEAYAGDKARIFAPRTIAIGNADDERSARMVAEAAARQAGHIPAGTRAAGTAMYRLRHPGPRGVGICGGSLPDPAPRRPGGPARGPAAPAAA